MMNSFKSLRILSRKGIHQGYGRYQTTTRSRKKLLNPLTGRMVFADGKIGKTITMITEMLQHRKGRSRPPKQIQVNLLGYRRTTGRIRPQIYKRRQKTLNPITRRMVYADGSVGKNISRVGVLYRFLPIDPLSHILTFL